LANSQGPWTVDHGPGLLEPFLRQIWISVRGGVDIGCRLLRLGPWLWDL